MIRFAVIGTNTITDKFLQAASALPDFKLCAVYSRTLARAQEYAQKNNVSLVFDSLEALADSDQIDAVYIASPNFCHAAQSILMMQHHKHVLCEKPAGVYTRQVREMNQAADKSQVIFAMMFNQRTNCIYRKMHEMVENGELGAIRRVNWMITDWYRTQSYYDSGNWRATWEGEGGGVLLNQCPHNLDLIQWICGMPSKVRSFCQEGKWHDIEVEDDVTAYLEYPNGATGVFITSTGDAPGTNRFEITGELGKLVCENEKLTFYKLKENLTQHCATCQGGFDKPQWDVLEVDTDGQNEQHIGVMKAFAGAILAGTPLVADGREGIRGLELSNAIHLSSWLGKTVELPIDEELFLEELNKRRANSKKKAEKESVVFDTENSYGSGQEENHEK